MRLFNAKNIQLYLLIVFFISVGLLILIYTNSFWEQTRLLKSSATQIYFVDNISEAHQQLIERFNRQHHGRIEVVPVNLPFTKFSTNERKELLARTLRSKGDRIDIFAVDLIWVPRFARWAQPLDIYFSAHERDRMLDAAMESCSFEEHLVAMPFYIDIGLMYYRRDLLRKLPNADALEAQLRKSITWEAFIALGQQYPGNGSPFYMFAAKNFEGLICSYLEAVMGQKRSIFAGDTVQLYTPESRKALGLLVDMVQTYRFTPPEVVNFDEVQVYRYALAHDALFFRGWPGFKRHFAEPGLEAKLAEVEVAALPHFQGTAPAAVYGGWNLMISNFSNHKPAAVEFLKFVMREENQALLYETGGYIPVNKALYEDSLFYRDKADLKYYRQLLDNGIHRPFVVNYTQISDIISYYVHLAIKGEIGVDAALKQATRVINAQTVLIR